MICFAQGVTNIFAISLNQSLIPQTGTSLEVPKEHQFGRQMGLLS